MRTSTRLILFPLLCSVALADWPGFLGPEHAAKSDDTQIPTTWSATDNMAWSVPLPGAGNSSPIVIGNQLILTCYSGYGLSREAPGNKEDLARHVISFDAKTGAKLWQTDVKARQPEDDFKGYIQEHGYASNTPVSDGESLFVFMGKTGLLAFDLKGNELWRAEIGMESNNKKWGSATPPVLYKDMVIVNGSDESQALVAFDKKTGREIWRNEAKLMSVVYAIPRFLKIDDRTDLVMRVSGEIWGLSPETGKLRWYVETPYPGSTTASVLHKDGMLYTFGGFPKAATVAVKLGGKGDLTKSIVWESPENPGIPTPILHDDLMYWIDGKGFAICLDAKTGERVYKERLSASGVKNYGSPLLIGDRIQVTTRNKGTFVYGTGRTFKEIANNVIEGDDTEFGATPAINDGSLYIRSWKALYCIRK